MSQPNRKQRYGDNPRSPISPTMEPFFLGGEGSKWSPASSSSSSSPMHPFGRNHDPEEDHAHYHKKSVLAKVRDKAKKWRTTFGNKKKHSGDGNTTPSWGVSLDDDEEEEEEEKKKEEKEDDAEYLGAPMYESELAPETYRETARQHPRAIPVISEKHILAGSVNSEKPENTKTISETVTEKLAPAYAAVSDATHAIASKLQALTISNPATPQAFSAEAVPQPLSGREAMQNHSGAPEASQNFSDEASLQPLSGRAASATHSAPAAPQTYSSTLAAQLSGKHFNSSEQMWDKGVSVKEYLMHKFEPGEDERALSQVISEAISPRKTPDDMSVAEKVSEAVTSLLWNNDSFKYVPVRSGNNPSSHIPICTTAYSAKNSPSPSQIPISTNAHLAGNTPLHIPVSTNVNEVGEEENHGRILQAN